jgi:hypothetical protein
MRRAAAAGGLTAIGLLLRGSLAAILRRRALLLQRYAWVVPPDGRTAAPLARDLAPVVAALRRVMPLVAGVARAVRKLALVAFVAAAVILAAVLAHGFPSSATEIVLTLVLAAMLAAPGAILIVFYLALDELLELPGRVRSLPRTTGVHVDELLRLERETRASGRKGGWIREPLVLWRLIDFLRSSSWILRPYTPVAAVLSPTLLVAVGLSAVAAVLLVPIALVAVIVSAFV